MDVIYRFAAHFTKRIGNNETEVFIYGIVLLQKIE